MPSHVGASWVVLNHPNLVAQSGHVVRRGQRLAFPGTDSVGFFAISPQGILVLNATRVVIFEGKQLCSPSELGGVLAMQGISVSCWRGDRTACSAVVCTACLSFGIASSSSACDAGGDGDSVMLRAFCSL